VCLRTSFPYVDDEFKSVVLMTMTLPPTLTGAVLIAMDYRSGGVLCVGLGLWIHAVFWAFFNR
jgi:hypothetical protein